MLEGLNFGACFVCVSGESVQGSVCVSGDIGLLWYKVLLVLLGHSLGIVSGSSVCLSTAVLLLVYSTNVTMIGLIEELVSLLNVI